MIWMGTTIESYKRITCRYYSGYLGTTMVGRTRLYVCDSMWAQR